MDFEILDDFVKYGLCSLHCGINMVKAILKIASQIEIRTHSVYGKQNKLKREIRAARNAQLLWDECGILVKDWFKVDGIL